VISFVAQTLLYEYQIKIMAYASLCDLFYASAAWKADLSFSHSLRKNTLEKHLFETLMLIPAISSHLMYI
jgi:hypothetical protein